MTTANQNISSEFVTEFVEFCACRRVDPEATLQFLGAQDWAAGKAACERGPAEKKRWREFNRQLKNLDYEPTLQQTKALLTSVMEPRAGRLQSALREAIAVTQEYLDSARLISTNANGEVEEITKPWCDEMAANLSRWRKALSESPA